MAASTSGGAASGSWLETAVASADSRSGPSTITLRAGVYLPTAPLRVDGDLTVVGPASGGDARLDGGSVQPFPSDLIVVAAHAKLTLWNLELSTGGGEGLAGAVDDFGEVDIESSAVAGNEGPGVIVEPGAVATLRNSTLSDGSAVGLIDDGAASLLNSTVAFNTGGGIFNSDGRLYLTNSIVADNQGQNCRRRATSSDHSLDSDGTCGVGTLGGSDPLLDTQLRANGGSTLTHALVPGSPAIGAGDSSRCPAEDQRHFVREGACDLGAYQLDARPGAGPAAGAGGAGSTGASTGPGNGTFLVSAHGLIRGVRHSSITFRVRAQEGQRRATFAYVDRARGVLLGTLTVTSLAVDAKRGTATLRGIVLEGRRRRRLAITLELVSHSGRRTLRIHLSNGYRESARLISGSVILSELNPRT
jgi:hypothetical protein